MSDDQAMTPFAQSMIIAAMIAGAAILQGRVAFAISYRSAEPDFLVIVLACGAMLVGGNRGMVLGLLAGYLTASLAANPFTPFGTILASRTIAGSFAAGLQRRILRDSVWVPPLVVLSTTLVCDLVYAAMAPHAWLHNLRPWLRIEGGELVFNVVLSYPCYLILRRMGVGIPREDPFGTGS